MENRVRGKKREADPSYSRGRPMTPRKNQARALGGTAGVGAQASEEVVARRQLKKKPCHNRDGGRSTALGLKGLGANGHRLLEH